jgi:hypothetical protein
MQNEQLLNVRKIIIIYINLTFTTSEIYVTGLTIMGTCAGKIPTAILSPTAIHSSNYPSDVHDPLTSISNIHVRVHFPNRFIFTSSINAASPT